MLAARRKDWRAAEQENRSLLRLSAQDTQGLYRLALVQERQGQQRQALESMYLALQTSPTDVATQQELKRLIEERFRAPRMPYLMAAPVFQPIVLVAALHALWLRISTRSMLAEHSPPVRHLIRQQLRAHDSSGCIQIPLATAAFFGFFWTLLTIVAWQDMATPTALISLAVLWLAVALLGFWLWRIKRRRRSL